MELAITSKASATKTQDATEALPDLDSLISFVQVGPLEIEHKWTKSFISSAWSSFHCDARTMGRMGFLKFSLGQSKNLASWNSRSKLLHCCRSATCCDVHNWHNKQINSEVVIICNDEPKNRSINWSIKGKNTYIEQGIREVSR